MAEKQSVSTGGSGSAAAPMCANGCGFYGSAIYNNFCSKCFKDSQAVEPAAAEEEKAATAIKPESSSSSNMAAAAAPPVTAAREATAAATEEQKEKEAPLAPISCATGCGFFGSAGTGNMCSKCYIDAIKNIDAAPELLEMIRANKAALVAAEKQPVPAAEDAAPAAPNRCKACRKKVGLLGFSCSCGGLFCSLHRHAEKHACEFDFKKAGRERIAEKNPLIAAPKIDKI